MKLLLRVYMGDAQLHPRSLSLWAWVTGQQPRSRSPLTVTTTILFAHDEKLVCEQGTLTPQLALDNTKHVLPKTFQLVSEGRTEQSTCSLISSPQRPLHTSLQLHTMGLTISSIFGRLFGNQERRILMGVCIAPLTKDALCGRLRGGVWTDMLLNACP